MATYKTKNIPGFENLLVIGDTWQLELAGEPFRVVMVEQLINTSVIIGDRELKLNIPDETLWIHLDNLEAVDDSEAKHEFASDNPYGEFKYEGRFTKGNLVIAHSVFDLAVSITIYETQPSTSNLASPPAQKTLYTASFFTNRTAALEMVEAMLHNDLDPEDLIFELQKLKETDYNG